jgi:Zn-finger nucleic acid-binding protein
MKIKCPCGCGSIAEVVSLYVECPECKDFTWTDMSEVLKLIARVSIEVSPGTIFKIENKKVEEHDGIKFT